MSLMVDFNKNIRNVYTKEKGWQAFQTIHSFCLQFTAVTFTVL